jgi:DNA ligase-associated metallophosphoesterase
MRAALKTVEQVTAGEQLLAPFAGSHIRFDPAGAAYFPDERMLVVSDLHLEKGSSFARKRIYLPPYDTAATLARLGALVTKHDPRIIVSLGDSFHDDEGSARLADGALAAIDAMGRGRQIIWVTGNHDPSPPEFVPGDTVDSFAAGPVTFRHAPDRSEFGREVCGHLHPCARIVRRGKSVRRPCFASDGIRLILPSFGVFTGGLNVCDPAFAGLFEVSQLKAYMLGTGRVYPIGAKELCGD